MRKVLAERVRDIGFSRAKRWAVLPPARGRTKISIRLNNKVFEFFKSIVREGGGGNYQTVINAALLEHIDRASCLDAVRQVVREELAPYGGTRMAQRGSTPRRTLTRGRGR